MEEDTIFAFDAPKESSSYIKVIGVGGGGSNAVNHMYSQGIKGVDFIVCNTDEKALNSSPVSNKIVLDRLGAGNNPQVAREAAEKNADTIREMLTHNTQMLFITAGMGGGTGTGASPVIAQIAKSIDLEDDVTGKILVVAIVTMPFSFEGRRRKEQAEAGIAELRKHVDSILVINNDKLRSFGDKTLSDAFALANDVLLTAAKGIAEIITANALVNIDFRDVNTVMHESGTALMGTGEGRGENRAIDAIKAATTSVLLNDNNISGAKDALLYISFSPENEVSMDELTAITDYVEGQISSRDCNVIWGYGEDASLSDDLIKVTLIATGFKQKAIELPSTSRNVIDLASDSATRSTQPVKQQPMDQPEAPYIVNHSEPEPAPEPQIIAEPTPTNIQTLEPEAKPIHVETTPDGHTKRIFDLNDAFEEQKPAINRVEDNYTNQKTVNFDDITLVTKTPTIEAPVMEAPKTIVHEAVQPTPQAAFATAVEPATAAPSVAPATEPVHFVTEAPTSVQRSLLDEKSTMSRAERIRHIHDMLTKNANGPQILEDMNPAIGLQNLQTSAMREAMQTTMDADGSLNLTNSYLYDNPD